MGKRREVTQEAALRKEMIQTCLGNSEVGSVEDVILLFKEAAAEFLNTDFQA